jgi:hypothetical protein
MVHIQRWFPKDGFAAAREFMKRQASLALFPEALAK